MSGTVSPAASATGTVVIRGCSTSSPCTSDGGGGVGGAGSDGDYQVPPWRRLNRPLRDMFSPLPLEEMFTPRQHPQLPTPMVYSNNSSAIHIDAGDGDGGEVDADYNARQPSFYVDSRPDRDGVGSPHGYLEGVSQIIPANVCHMDGRADMSPINVDILPPNIDGDGADDDEGDEENEEYSVLSSTSSTVPAADVKSFRMKVTKATTESALAHVQSFDVSVLVVEEDGERDDESASTVHRADEQQAHPLDRQTISENTAHNLAPIIFDADATPRPSVRPQELTTLPAPQFKFNYSSTVTAQQQQLTTTPRRPGHAGRAPTRQAGPRKFTPRLSRSLSPVKNIIQSRGGGESKLNASSGTRQPTSLCLMHPPATTFSGESGAADSLSNSVKLFQLYYNTMARDRLSALVSELDSADEGAITSLEDQSVDIGFKRLKLSDVSFQADGGVDAATTTDDDRGPGSGAMPVSDTDEAIGGSAKIVVPSASDSETTNSQPAKTINTRNFDAKSPLSRQMMKALASVQAAMDPPMLSTVMEDSREIEELHAASLQQRSNKNSTLSVHHETSEQSGSDLFPSQQHFAEPIFGGSTNSGDSEPVARPPPPSVSATNVPGSRSTSHGSTDTAIRIVSDSARPPPFLIKPEDVQHQIPRQMGSMMFDQSRGLWVRQTEQETDDPFRQLAEEEQPDATQDVSVAMSDNVHIEFSKSFLAAEQETDHQISQSGDDVDFSAVSVASSSNLDDEDTASYAVDDTVTRELSVYENVKLENFYKALRDLKVEADAALGWQLASVTGNDPRPESPLESVKRLLEVLGSRDRAAQLEEANLCGRQLDSLYGLSDICPRLRVLDCSQNNIGFLGGVPATLKKLFASHNHLGDATVWDHLTNLCVIDVSENPIADTSFVEKLSHLVELAANKCAFPAIPLFPQSVASNIRRLSLRCNEICAFPSNVSFPNLFELDLGENRITSVSLNRDMVPRLRKLSLDRNKLIFFELSGVASTLRELDLSHNSLKTLAGLQCSSLELLDVSNNSLEAISILPKMDSIRVLKASNCLLLALPADLAIKLPVLNTLLVSNNSLESIDAVRRCRSLQSLDLSKNKISSLSSCISALRRLGNLTSIDLRENPFTVPFCNADKHSQSADNSRTIGAASLSDGAYIQRMCYKSAIIQLLPALNHFDGAALLSADKKVAKMHYEKLKERVCITSRQPLRPLPRSRSLKFWVDVKGNTLQSELPQFERIVHGPRPPIKDAKAVPARGQRYLATKAGSKRGDTKCYVYSADGKPMALERRT